MKKFEFTGETKTISLFFRTATLHRIRAVAEFGLVKIGDLGGWIEKEENLSHEGKMFSVQCSILEGNQKGRKIFFNRTISGNTSQKWTNGMAIKSVCTWLDKLETDTVPEFINYSDFADCVLDIFQEVQGKVGAAVTYKADDFNPITINEAFDM